MIPSELLFMQEILTNSIYEYDISNEFSNWMKYNYYPVVSWTVQDGSYGILSQNFSTSYGKWWIPIRLILQNFNLRESHMLSSQDPVSYTFYSREDFIMIDIRQAGKYVSKLFIFIFIHIYIYYIYITFQVIFFRHFLVPLVIFLVPFVILYEYQNDPLHNYSSILILHNYNNIR